MKHSGVIVFVLMLGMIGSLSIYVLKQTSQAKTLVERMLK